jgi:hypothetical protein
MLHIFLMGLVIGAATPSVVQDAAKGQDPGIVVQGEKENKAGKRVCKRSVPTGSVMPKITCRTGSEWQAERERSLSQMDAMRNEQRIKENKMLESMLSGKR